MEEILKAVSKQTGISAEDILSRKRDFNTSEARRIFMYIASSSGEPDKRIATFINRSRCDISQQLKVIRTQINIYKSLNKKVEKISNGIWSEK
jgi:chromosomal replication initiation ATPase DnaA